jgi:dihydroflavonol-4-reductase
MSDRRTIAITGATGFVGRHVVERLLLEPDVDLRCLRRPGRDAGGLPAARGRITHVEGDVVESTGLDELLHGAWGVINLAGNRDFWNPSRAAYYDLNQKGAENVFRAAVRAGVGKAVQVSTPLAFGVPERIPFDETDAAGPHPSDYARSKHLGDRAAWDLHRDQQLPLTVVHLAAVIGAGDPRPTMEVGRAVKGNLPALVGADTTYTYVHVRDAAEAIVRALFSDHSTGRAYLVGTERATTREYFEIIGQLAGVSAPALNLPESLLLPFAYALEWLASITGQRPALPVDILKTTQAGSLLFDGSRAVRELGMEYQSLEQALREAVAEIQGASRAG